jgi:hypothetical protein
MVNVRTRLVAPTSDKSLELTQTVAMYMDRRLLRIQVQAL